MRPSDVPTYVEHGAADIGITGKDVLLEQPEREVYELLDLGYGRCRMVVAARIGDDALGRVPAPARSRARGDQVSARGLRPLRRDGRQAEIVEVKGRWSCARSPASWTGSWTSPPRARRSRERARGARADRRYRAADRQPRGPQAEGGRRSTSWSAGAGRMRLVAETTAGSARGSVAARLEDSPRHRARGCAAGRRAVLELTERFDRAELGPEELRVDPGSSTPRSAFSSRTCWRGSGPPSRTWARWRRPSCARRWRSICPRASALRSWRCRAPRSHLRAGRPRALWRRPW